MLTIEAKNFTTVDGRRPAFMAKTTPLDKWNFKYVMEPLYTAGGRSAGKFGIFREGDDSPSLGEVLRGERYFIMQPSEMLAMMERMVEDFRNRGVSLKLRNACILREGRTLVAIFEREGDNMLLGEQYNRFIFFYVGNDGKTAIGVSDCALRIVCANQLVNAFSKNSLAFKKVYHSGATMEDVYDAWRDVALNNHAWDSFKDMMESFAMETLTATDVNAFVEKVLPLPKKADKGTQEMRTEVERVYAKRDILKNEYLAKQDLEGLKRGGMITKAYVLQAMSDYSTHLTPLRVSSKHEDTLMSNSVSGDPLIQKSIKLLSVA